jgi:hypothetical protein
MLNHVLLLEVDNTQRNAHLSDQFIPEETLVESSNSYHRFLCGLRGLKKLKGAERLPNPAG